MLQTVEDSVDLSLKKQLGRELPMGQIPKHQTKDYAQAEEKEWGTWTKTGCVSTLSPGEAARVR